MPPNAHTRPRRCQYPGLQPRDELLNREVFNTLTGAKVLKDQWRREYKQFRPHSVIHYTAAGFPGHPCGSTNLTSVSLVGAGHLSTFLLPDFGAKDGEFTGIGELLVPFWLLPGGGNIPETKS